MAPTRYRIPDEPRPGGLAHLTVDPIWPFFALMLCGPWLAIPWFLLNGLALGTPTQRREWLALAGMIAGSLAVVLLISALTNAGFLQGVSLRLSLLSIIALKLGLGMAVTVMQARSFELWSYYGGNARNGLVVLVVGFLANRALAQLVEDPILHLVLA